MDTAPKTAVLRTLLVSDLVGSTRLVEELGDRAAAELAHHHDRLARDLLAAHGGLEIDKTDGFLLLFEKPLDAIRYAVDYHAALRRISDEEGRRIEARVGIHFGEVVIWENPPDDVARGAKARDIEGMAKPMTARLMSLAEGRQTLLTRGAFDLGRRATVGVDDPGPLVWLAHGAYLFKGVEDPVEVFEVGREGEAPLALPADSEKAKRVMVQKTIPGWRPAPGLAIPHRAHWLIEKKLGEGGFGEAWLASHRKTHDRRVFKFCYDPASLQSLQREITLFRLLKEELGERDDISRIVDWSFDEPPYFIESDYTEAGNLVDWAAQRGGLAEVPLAVRLEIVAQVATALAAAHSVGVLHKDVKPSNILIATGKQGEVQARLCDFGVGAVTDAKRLADAGITVLGLSARSEMSTASSYSGTRLYTAPELLEGKPATLQADVYALGLVLYQMVVGDLSRALAPGWRRDVADELLCEDVAAAVDGSPERRIGNALRLADRLRALDSRRQKREAERREKQEAAQLRATLERTRRRRRLLVAAVVVLALFAGAMATMVVRVRREAARVSRMVVFLEELFEVTDPYDLSDPGAERGSSITVRELLDRSLVKLDTAFEDDPLTRAHLMGTLGRVYRHLGHYEEAEPLLDQALALRRQARGDEHPDVAESLYDLADLLSYKGDYEGAEPLFRESLEMRRRLLGDEHPKVAESLHGLAFMLWNNGNYEDAEPLLRESLELSRRLLGDEHPYVSFSLNGLAAVLQLKGDYEGAEPLFRESLEMRRRLLGDEHAYVANGIFNLALLLQFKGDYEGAEPLCRESLEMYRRLLGDEDPHVGLSLGLLASILVARSQAAEAEALAREALEILRKSLLPDHWMIVYSESALGSALAALGRYEEADPLLAASYPVVRDQMGASSLLTRDILARLVVLYEAWGQPEKAAEYRAMLDAAGDAP